MAKKEVKTDLKEFGEGVDRIYRDMAQAGLPDPEYRQADFMLYATLKNKNWGKDDKSWPVTPESSSVDSVQEKILAFCAEPKSRKEIMEFVGLTNRDYFYNHYIVPLLNSEMLLRTIPDKPTSSKQKYVRRS